MSKLANTHTRLVETLGSLIATGKIGKDGILPREDDLVQRFGVSRTIVREATKTLQALGLVVTRPRIGSKIMPISSWRLLDPQVMQWISGTGITPDLARDLIDLRSMVEPAAAAMAAQRATPEQVTAIVSALGLMKRANTKTAHRQADFAFHEAILLGSQNTLLLQLRPVLRAVLEGSFSLSMNDDERIRQSIELHEKVSNAILSRNSNAAREAMMGLIISARADIERENRIMPSDKTALA